MKKLICAIFGHRYRLLRQISPTIQELNCSRCKKEFGINHTVKAVLPMDDELRKLHNDILNNQLT
jgi:hypothetical protein